MTESVNPSQARGQTPGFWVRLLATILVLVIAGSVIGLIIGSWYRSTILSVDWYRPVIHDPALVTSLRTAILDEAIREVDKMGLLAPVVSPALPQVITNERVEAFMNTYLESFVRYLNDPSRSPLPDNAADLFQSAFLTAARDIARKLGLTLPASAELQIGQMGARFGTLAASQIDSFRQENFDQLAMLDRYHRMLLTVSGMKQAFMIALAAALLLLFLLFFRQLIRFFTHSAFGVWLAGAVISLPLLVIDWLDPVSRLPIPSPVVKTAVVSLSNSAIDHLKQSSLTLFGIASMVLLLVLVVNGYLRRSAD